MAENMHDQAIYVFTEANIGMYYGSGTVTHTARASDVRRARWGSGQPAYAAAARGGRTPWPPC